MISGPYFKNLTIKKVAKRAYSVSGAPVVTLGMVEIEFKIGDACYRHEFMILRGLIHPLLLGLDFLTKFSANIQLGETPTLTLRHPVNKIVSVNFLKRSKKTKRSAENITTL